MQNETANNEYTARQLIAELAECIKEIEDRAWNWELKAPDDEVSVAYANGLREATRKIQRRIENINRAEGLV